MAVCFETTVGRLQAITYFISVIISLFVVIPMGITLRRFQGSCILWGQIVWDGKTIWPWTETACDYVLYMNLSVTFFYAIVMGIYSTCLAVPRRWPFAQKHYDKIKEVEKHDEKFKIIGANPVFMLINTVVFFMVLSNAVVITVGLGKFCSWTMDALEEAGTPISTCSKAQSVINWAEMRIIRGNDIGVDGSQFYVTLGIATIASWALFLTWLFQWILNFSQSFTMCSCDVAEEKRRPDAAARVAARRSRLATPIGTPGHMTPGGRYTPPVGAGVPMRPYTFGPPPQQQHYPRSVPQPYITRPQQQQPMQMQQGYAPPRY